MQHHKKQSKTKAIAYLRTSSAANVGRNGDKDSDQRQRVAISEFAEHSGMDIVAEYYDAAVSGADRIEDRKGFAEMLAHIAGNGVRTIIVETASRFARDLIVQETGFAQLQSLGVTLVAADSPNAFLDDTPTAQLIRQILGAVSQFEKAMLVAKLKGARERLKVKRGKVEGRKAYAERDAEQWRELSNAAKALNDGRSLQKISDVLKAQGFTTKKGNAYSPSAVKSILAQAGEKLDSKAMRDRAYLARKARRGV
jgi:DNA invertase Pin-like site-specific DNA recombinase